MSKLASIFAFFGIQHSAENSNMELSSAQIDAAATRIERLEALEAEAEQKNKVIAELQDKLQAKELARLGLQSANETLTSENNKLKAAIDVANSENAKLREQNEALSNLPSTQGANTVTNNDGQCAAQVTICNPNASLYDNIAAIGKAYLK